MEFSCDNFILKGKICAKISLGSIVMMIIIACAPSVTKAKGLMMVGCLIDVTELYPRFLCHTILTFSAIVKFLYQVSVTF